MADFDWLGAGVKVLGGLLGANDASNGTTKTSQTSMDPRFDPFIWGDSKTTGIVPQAYANYQANPSGLNQQMVDGLNRQWNTYSDPATAQGYTNMQGLGASLMGAPISGNPFSDGRIALASGTGAGQVGQSSFGQQTYNNPATQTGQNPFSVTQPVKAPAPVSGGLLGSVVPAQTPSAIGAAQGDGQGSGGMGNGGVGGVGTPGGATTGFNGNPNSVASTGAIGGWLGGLLGGPLGGLVGTGVAGAMNASSDPTSMNPGQMAAANVANTVGYTGTAANGLLGGPDTLSMAMGPTAFGTVPGTAPAFTGKVSDVRAMQDYMAAISAGVPGMTAAQAAAMGYADMLGNWGNTGGGYGRGGGFGTNNSAGGNDGMGTGGNAGSNGNGGNANA